MIWPAKTFRITSDAAQQHSSVQPRGAKALHADMKIREVACIAQSEMQ